MKTLICSEPGKLAYGLADKPESEPDHAIIRIKRVGICGTDWHAFEGTQPFFNYPRILGHELSGELVDTGGAEGFNIGDIVSFMPYFNCGHCIACRSGKPNCCIELKVCGVHLDGGMAEYLSVPATSLLHGQGLSLDELALVEPLAIGAHGVRRAQVKPGETVLVVGAGPIGLCTLAFAKIAGAKTITLDIDESRLRFCEEKLGVDHAINASSTDVTEQLMTFTNGNMPSVVIDATGSLSAINNAFRYMSFGGRYVLIGLQKNEIQFSHPEFHKREGTLMSSRNALRSDFEHVISSIREGLIKPLDFITHRVPFAQAKEAIESKFAQQNNLIKAMISFD